MPPRTSNKKKKKTFLEKHSYSKSNKMKDLDHYDAGLWQELDANVIHFYLTRLKIFIGFMKKHIIIRIQYTMHSSQNL